MAAKRAKKIPAKGTGSRSILIIEDDEFLAKMMARMLEDAGLRCQMAGNGKEGLRKAQADVPRSTQDLRPSQKRRRRP